AQASWTDEVYLSKTQTPSPSDPVLVYNAAQYAGNFPLGANQSYTVDTSGFLQGLAPGNYFLVYVANADHEQGETDSANPANNTAIIPITISAPDLTVTAADITGHPAILQPSTSYTVNFTVKNAGTVDALGYWSDTVYLSNSPTYNQFASTYLGSIFE